MFILNVLFSTAQANEKLQKKNCKKKKKKDLRNNWIVPLCTATKIYQRYFI